MATTARALSAQALRRAKTGRRHRPTVSLERALSKLGLASRSQARALILEGRVAVFGTVVTTPSMRIVPEGLAIAIDGARTDVAQPLTIVLHKPRGYVTTRSDPEGRRQSTTCSTISPAASYRSAASTWRPAGCSSSQTTRSLQTG